MKGLLALAACVSLLWIAAPGQVGRAVTASDDAPIAVGDDRTALAGRAFVLEDPSCALTIDDVRGPAAPRFRRLPPGGDRTRGAAAAYWLRFRVTNPTASPAFVVDLSERAPPSPATAELYDEAGRVVKFSAARPFGERPVPSTSVVFRIALDPGADRTFWIRQWSPGPLQLAPVVWSEQRFWKAQSDQRMRDGVCYGVLAGLALYNLFLFLALRDRSYLLYVVFQILNGLTQAAIDKYAFQYLWPDHPVWAFRSEQVLACLTLAAALAFARAFLEPHRRSRWLDQAMRALPIANAALAAAGAAFDHAGLHAVIRTTLLASLGVITLAAVHAAAHRGSTNARVFLVAWITLLAGAAMAALTSLGVLLWPGAYAVAKLGSAIEAVLLSLALAGRIQALTRDRERAQRELLAAEAARIEALRRLVSGVAHEIGNPLNFARGGSDELALQLAAIGRQLPEAEAPARRAHTLVALGLSRIKLILDNLRSYLSIGDPEPVATDLAHEIDEALALAGARAAAAGVRIERQIAQHSDALPVVRARPGELHQVLINLIGNALDAMPGGGTLRVAARAGERDVEVTVDDTGPGIAAADRDRVFEPFFTTRRDAGGTGLGLAVAREIAMKNGGTLRAEDRPGGGARLVLVLPRR